MPISINWDTKVIYIPQSYLTDLGDNVYKLDLDQFRLDLKGLEDDEDGIIFLDIHDHRAEVTLAGITLGRVVEIINGYTITFEDGQYAVEAKGANSNIADVMNLNQVSLRTFNSAGLIVVTSGSGLSTEEHDQLMSLHSVSSGRWKISGTQMIFYEDDNITEIARFDLYDKYGQLTSDPTKVFERRRV